MEKYNKIDAFSWYEEDNCVPCCKMCNTMKMDYQFEAWVTKMQVILKKLGKL